MTMQKIFGLLVNNEKEPIIDKPEGKEQCYICGFNFADEKALNVLVNNELTDKRKVHAKCIENHFKLLPSTITIAMVNAETNKVLTHITANEKT